MLGGFSQGRDLSEEEVQMVHQLRDQIEQSAQTSFEHFIPLRITSQVVAGTNYMVKIQVSNDKCVHAKIFKPLPYTNKAPELTDLQLDLTIESDF
eukprot:403337465